ncbi:uncharacterized protein LOC5512901 [Nematostella vectensis]|uniref:uncharacterized protein LOC5512901 n=1 Tax=Nematostella vectensis TaxID=45351 RepID=UPI002077987B|nr:uncharacterized protein LOC5512901 [Nematostella vectensis]
MVLSVYACITMVIQLVKHASSQTCPQGVCYGGTYKATERKQGHYLVGFSYKNLSTVRHAQGCFSACVNECQCRSYQVSSSGCELLEEDRYSKPSNFSSNPDYSYYDLQQKIIPSTSYLANPAVCRNGCCLFNFCLNGGTCREKCDHPKTKLVCECPAHASGKRCEVFLPKTCLDFYKQSNVSTNPTRGVYTLFKNNNIGTLDVYCDFTPPKKAWVLIESFALKYNLEFKNKSFLENYRVNQAVPNHKKYRLSRVKMERLRATAVSYRVTCKFLTRENVTDRDYLEGRLTEWKITEEESDYPSTGFCKRVTYADIEGHSCTNCTLALFQKPGKWHVHSTPRLGCDLQPPSYTVIHDAFGWYNPVRSTFLCTDSQDSTTAYWLGYELP